MSLFSGRLSGVEVPAWRLCGNAGFHDLRVALASTDHLIHDGGKFFLSQALSGEINQHVVRNQVWLHMQHRGVTLKIGGKRLPYRGAAGATEHQRDTVMCRFSLCGLVSGKEEEEAKCDE